VTWSSGWNLSEAVDRRDAIAMTGLLVAALGALWILGELIPVGEGFGFGDGRTYGQIGMSFPEFRYVDEYRMARILPGLAVNTVHRLVPGEATVVSTVWLFRFMNVTLLAAGSAVWYSLVRELSIRRAAAWIGFGGLFLNFAHLKFALYYPTLTDTAAFAFGMLLLYAFVKGNVALTGAVAVAAAFISPVLAVCALLLFVVPRIDVAPLTGDHPGVSRVATAAAVAAGIAAGAFLWRVDERLGGTIVSGGDRVWENWLWVSVGIVALYLAAASRPLLLSLLASGREAAVRLAGSKPRARRLLARAAAALALTAGALGLYQLGVDVTARRMDVLFDRMLYTSIARPLAFGIAHVAHFGPILILTVLLWPGIGRIVHRFGPGLVLLFGGILLLGLTSESRTITAVLPFVVLATVLAADELEWRPWGVGVLTVLALAVSRFWFPLNQGPIDEGPALEFPAQFYFMNFGPWMSGRSYTIFAVVLAAATAVVVLSMRGVRARS
jgi:hypothetical protein